MSSGLYSSILITVSGQRFFVAFFGLLEYKSTIIKPETVQITTVKRNYFQRKWEYSSLKLGNLLVVKRGTKIRNRNSGM
jgi:uncharacterized membrane protein YdbT with pleckstrin-like domain